MHYEIIELGTTAEGAWYALVHFWKKKTDKNKAPVLINDFVVSATVVDRGYDLDRYIHEAILSYWERAEKHVWRGDHSSAAVLTQPFTEKGKVLRRAGELNDKVVSHVALDPELDTELKDKLKERASSLPS